MKKQSMQNTQKNKNKSTLSPKKKVHFIKQKLIKKLWPLNLIIRAQKCNSQTAQICDCIKRAQD